MQPVPHGSRILIHRGRTKADFIVQNCKERDLLEDSVPVHERARAFPHCRGVFDNGQTRSKAMTARETSSERLVGITASLVATLVSTWK